MGLGDVQAAPACIFQARPWGGCPSPHSPGRGGQAVALGRPLGGGGPQPSGAGASPGPGAKRLFRILTPDRREGAGEAQGGRVSRAQTADGDPGGRAPWSRGEGREPAYRLARAQLPAAPLPPHGFLRPGLPGRRWQGAGRAAPGGGRRARGVGPPRSRGRGGWGVGEEVLPGGGRARRGVARPAPLISARSPPPSGADRPAARADAGWAWFICVSLACHLHRPYAHSSGPQEREGESG